MKKIAFNADLGEGAGHDRAIMPLISCCSIACGGHYGNRESIAETLAIAHDFGVATGAHPAYPDPMGFGRKSLSISLDKLTERIESQLNVFYSLCSEVHHIKFHGALYNDLYHDTVKANAMVDVILRFDAHAKVFCFPGSALLHAVRDSTLIPVREGFADRAYTRGGELLSRKHPNAIHSEANGLIAQVLNFVEKGGVQTLEGNWIDMPVDTLCFHGDNPRIVPQLVALHQVLKKKQIDVGFV